MECDEGFSFGQTGFSDPGNFRNDLDFWSLVLKRGAQRSCGGTRRTPPAMSTSSWTSCFCPIRRWPGVILLAPNLVMIGWFLLRFPSLCRERRAWMKIMSSWSSWKPHPHHEGKLRWLVEQSAPAETIMQDRDLLAACRLEGGVLSLLEPPFSTDRDLAEAALSQGRVKDVSHEARHLHVDLVCGVFLMPRINQRTGIQAYCVRNFRKKYLGSTGLCYLSNRT